MNGDSKALPSSDEQAPPEWSVANIANADGGLRPNVQKTIKPIITGGVAQGTLIHTDEHGCYGRLERWGYGHKTVCHEHGEYAHDEICEVHVNTIESFWSLLRSRLRPHRGVSQEKRPGYLGFFQFVHNGGKALLGPLIARLVQ